MKENRPLILISNDDGYEASGINSLLDFVSDFGDVIVCAPNSARSGFACAFSATEPLLLTLREKRPEVQIWSCTGTPVDCVKLALSQICPRKPDLVLSGINHGDNGSVNTHYSGTMGAAMEGCMKYIPSVAFSLCDHNPQACFEPLRHYVRNIVSRVMNEGLPKGVCLNVNFPLASEFRGVRICRMARGTWGNEVVKARHPRGYDYYWLVGSYTNDEPQAEDTDNRALMDGYVAVTPTRVDVTDYETMEKMKEWENMFL